MAIICNYLQERQNSNLFLMHIPCPLFGSCYMSKICGFWVAQPPLPGICHAKLIKRIICFRQTGKLCCWYGFWTSRLTGLQASEKIWIQHDLTLPYSTKWIRKMYRKGGFPAILRSNQLFHEESAISYSDGCVSIFWLMEWMVNGGFGR